MFNCIYAVRVRVGMIKMPIERKWFATYPRIWNQWETKGKTYIIQNLPPQGEKQTLEILFKDFCADEYLRKLSGLLTDQESITSFSSFWAKCMSQGMSLGCYTAVEGKKTLVAVNICVVDSIKEPFPFPSIEGTAWRNVFHALKFAESRCDPFQYLNLDTLLRSCGLSVARQFRGTRLGAKMLMAREHLAIYHGIKGSTAIVSGLASQKLAASCGFITIRETSVRELANAGLNYPKSDHIIKTMVKRYCID